MVFLLIAVSLFGCGGRSAETLPSPQVAAADESVGAVPEPQPEMRSRMAIAAAKPVDAYVMLGGRIKTCWFNPSDALLPDHVYRADVAPDGSKVQISVHDKRNLGRAGATAYTVDFNQEGAYTVVTTRNLKMLPKMAAKMQYDITRWKAGEVTCTKDMPKVAAQPAPKEE